jgi:ferric-dicitrate binding protein FerR (iron transport regulator)
MTAHDKYDSMPTRPDTAAPDDAGIEELLRQVGARAEPSEDMMREVQAAVFTEWQAVVSERRRRRLSVAWGMAASFALAVLAATFGLRYVTRAPDQIATISRIDGHLLAATEQDAWSARGVGQSLVAGETIQTDDRSRVALAFPGNVSVRLDRSTTLRMAATDHLVLESGALYVDSPTNTQQITDLTVQAHAGSVRHVGTQYEIRTHADDIEVSVREGRVMITNAAGTSTGEAGERIRVTPQGEVTRHTLAAHDTAWRWAVSAAPVFDINDRPLSSFLQWIARETGRQVVYASAQAASAAEQVKLRGSIAGLDPDTALTAVLATTQLRRFATKDAFIGIALEPAIDTAAPERPTR